LLTKFYAEQYHGEGPDGGYIEDIIEDKLKMSNIMEKVQMEVISRISLRIN
jgi:hypothetical protein